jgi:hypothetical protein
MPHRKSPSGVARNYIMQNAMFDRIKKESINTLDVGDVLAELGRVFPEDSPTMVVCPEGFEAVKGLVLNDPYGCGALEPKVKPTPLSLCEFMKLQSSRLEVS